MYSEDFRNKVVQTYRKGNYSYRMLASKFEVSLTFITNLIQHFKKTGEIVKKIKYKKVKDFKITGKYELILLELIKNNPSITLNEISDFFYENHDLKVGKSSVDRKLNALKITYKKKTNYNPKKDSLEYIKEHNEYIFKVLEYNVSNLVFIDESGVNRGLTKRYGRAKSGKRAIESFDDKPKDSLTLVSAISLNGLFAEAEFKGSMDKVRFQNYSKDILLPELKAGQVLVMDNLSSHKGKEIEKVFAEKGVHILYLPTHTPEYNPIEMMWAKIKHYLRKNRSKDIFTLKENITKAFALINIQDIKAWFNHCGYECS